MNNKTLILNCDSGISGDMTVAALLDLGADEQVLRDAIDSLHLEGASIAITRVKKSALDVCDFNVILDELHENHDHDMAYLHPQESYDHHSHAEHPEGHHEHTHSHADHQECHHEHTHNHSGHHVHHNSHGRNLHDITQILRQADLTDRARELAIRIFRILAEAEAKAHGKSVEEVHFHEVGAVDSIIDITACAVCVDHLGITDTVVTNLTEGSGSVRCQHGLLPIPVPATAEILRAYGIPFCASGIRGELITPTGAAIIAALRTKERTTGAIRIISTGMGAGKRDYEASGILRAILVEEDSEIKREMTTENTGSPQTEEAPVKENRMHDTAILLQTNLDDCTGEALGFTMDALFRSGARDVWYTPIFMKKNRPAYQLNVLCAEADQVKMEDIIFRHTTTIGIRSIFVNRTKLPRIETTVGMSDEIAEDPAAENSSKESARVKIRIRDQKKEAFPEADDVCRIAQSKGAGFLETYRTIQEAANRLPGVNQPLK